jgi:hypothetical protein
MALRPPAKPAAPTDDEAVQRVIAGGSDTLGDKRGQGRAAEAVPPVGRDISFTMTIPAALAARIDRHRTPTKTSRRAWLLQAAEERLKREEAVCRYDAGNSRCDQS